MPILDDLRSDLTEITTLKFISAAFAEAAAARIGKIRTAFESNRMYFEEISQLYHVVKVSAGRKDKLDGTARKSGATLSVALTSNHRFYGQLNINTMDSFVRETKQVQTDLMVVGQTGIDYLSLIQFSRKYEPVKWAKDAPSAEEERQLLDRVKPYGTVFLFYPKFQTMLRQSVEMVDITQTATPEEIAKERMLTDIFEPQLSQILEFFDSQVRAVLFKRAVLEAELSRTAARLLAMSAAEERADKLMKEKRTQIGKVKATILNTQLMETFVGRNLWKK